MTGLERNLREVGTLLSGFGKRWAVVGGLAVSARAEPRLTRDADLAVAVGSDREAEQLVADLQAHGYRVIAAVEQDAVGRLATVRLLPPEHVDRSVVDLLFASSGIEAEVVAGAEQLGLVPGLVVPVASIGHLVALKLLARDDRHRPNDADDLASLAIVATPADWAVAARAVQLIEERGYSRSRDLADALVRLRRGGAY